MQKETIELISVCSGEKIHGNFFIYDGCVAQGETVDSFIRRMTRCLLLDPDKVIKETSVNGNVTKTEVFNLKKYYSYEVDKGGIYFYGDFEYPHRIDFKFSKQEGGE